MSTEQMTCKERVLAAVKYDDVDRLPVFRGYFTPTKLVNRKLNYSYWTDGEAIADSCWQAWKYFDDDIILTLDGGFMTEEFGAKFKWPEDDYPQNNTILVKSHADADALPDPDPYKDPVFLAIMKATQILRKKAGDEVLVGGFINGTFNYVASLMGAENLMMFLATDPELIHKVCKKVAAAQVRYAKAYGEAGIELIFMPDACSAPACISPKTYGKMALPYLKQAVKGFQDAGALAMYHPCGGEYPIIDQIGQTKADIYYFSELVDLDAAQKIFVDRAAVAGTVNGSKELFLGTTEEVDLHVKGIIDKLKYRTGAIILPGCGLSPNCKYENVKAMIDAVKKYGKN
ncbi:MAG: uroporphyrinogen decarboxylase family protein [Gracilibacteraceae bacterium]|jgi:uroporphyrinogen decarboxylase|nr:uroporphyrinogen decarboxylase family protein [Gracilibacteraceae bacterium]